MRARAISLILAAAVSCFYVYPSYGAESLVSYERGSDHKTGADREDTFGDVENISIEEEMSRTDLQVEFFEDIPELMDMDEELYDAPPDDVISLMVPESFDFMIDIYNTSGYGQILSRNYIFENNSSCDLEITIDSISYSFANDTDFAAVTSYEQLDQSSDKKELYLYLEDVTDIIDMDTGIVSMATPSQPVKKSTPSEPIRVVKKASASEAQEHVVKKATPSQIQAEDRIPETKEELPVTSDESAARSSDTVPNEGPVEQPAGTDEPAFDGVQGSGADHITEESSQDEEQTVPEETEEFEEVLDETESPAEDDSESDNHDKENQLSIVENDTGELLKAVQDTDLEEEETEEEYPESRETDQNKIILSNTEPDGVISFTLSSADNSTDNIRVFRLNGAVSQTSKKSWEDGDVKVNMLFTCTPLLEEEEELPLEEEEPIVEEPEAADLADTALGNGQMSGGGSGNSDSGMENLSGGDTGGNEGALNENGADENTGNSDGSTDGNNPGGSGSGDSGGSTGGSGSGDSGSSAGGSGSGDSGSSAGGSGSGDSGSSTGGSGSGDSGSSTGGSGSGDSGSSTGGSGSEDSGSSTGGSGSEDSGSSTGGSGSGDSGSSTGGGGSGDSGSSTGGSGSGDSGSSTGGSGSGDSGSSAGGSGSGDSGSSAGGSSSGDSVES